MVFSKTHPPQFLNNKYASRPKHNYYSILLPLHLPIYILWCSCTTTLFLILIEKCAYTYIFIRILALHIHFIFILYFFDITPINMQTIIFYTFKVVLCSFIYVYLNESLKRIFEKMELQLRCNEWSFIKITLFFKLQWKLSAALN